MPDLRNPIDNRSFRLAGAVLAAAALGAGGLALWQTPAISAEDAVSVPPPAMDEKPGTGTETAVFAGGCFWGVQGVFQHVKGVTDAVSGYAGGDKDTAVYETVGSGRTGHAETVKITYEPAKITYGQLLQVYFSVAHNPTAAELPGTGPGHAVPLDDLCGKRRAEEDRRKLHRPARQGQGVWRSRS